MKGVRPTHLVWFISKRVYRGRLKKRVFCPTIRIWSVHFSLVGALHCAAEAKRRGVRVWIESAPQTGPHEATNSYTHRRYRLIDAR